ncbi:ABC transporter permease, partial [Bacteroidota bacterium]
MLNYRTFAVFKREVKEKVMSKSFILMTILLPVFMFMIIGVQTLIMSYGRESKAKIDLVTESFELTDSFEKEFSQREFVKNGNLVFNYLTMSREEFDSHLKINKNEIINESKTGMIFIPETALQDKNVEYYAKTGKDLSLSDRLGGAINKVLIESYFREKGLTEDELSYARQWVEITSYKVTESDELEEEGFGSLIISYLFAFLLYLSLLMMGQMTMNSVLEEKNNRIVEVLLSSVSPKELMAGKIFGASVTGTFQMGIWLLPVILVVSTTWFVLPEKYMFSVTAFQMIYMLVNFFIGLVTFLGLFATVGAIFESQQEAQSGMWPVMMLAIIPFFIAMSLVVNPNSPIGEIAALLPFASIIVMPTKMALVDIPVWQLSLAFVVNIATIFVIFPVAGKIYRVGI